MEILAAFEQNSYFRVNPWRFKNGSANSLLSPIMPGKNLG
jgi:hypothetical protein